MKEEEDEDVAECPGFTHKDEEQTEPWMRSTGLRRNKKKRDRRNIRDISLLETVEATNTVNLVGDGWEELKIAVDSGATESVVSREDAVSIPVVPGEASKAGVKYSMANGDVIENEGEKRMQVSFGEGPERLLTVQVTDVTKPLLS
eukprot:3806195-Karenia_brevis.AAC.1